ncbi:MAG TPA: L-rhamnose/proton symporter RhaT, partial [Phnomibacter sp.]|nr:L-rhamnose/proton symporter RhaT [Phnomibacter sp.]
MNGILLHGIGATSASLCYTPQKKIKSWSWQTYWLAQAAVCWLVLPVVVAVLTIPHLSEVLQQAPATAMRQSFVLGFAYGIGGTAFGLAIRYIGLSLTYAISVGISCVLGTLLPPLVSGNLGNLWQQNGSVLLLSGVLLGAIGIAICGWAGRSKEIDLQNKNTSNHHYSLKIGLPLCLLAGLLSALYGYAINRGQPIA